jgi:hypothetical protein
MLVGDVMLAISNQSTLSILCANSAIRTRVLEVYSGNAEASAAF